MTYESWSSNIAHGFSSIRPSIQSSGPWFPYLWRSPPSLPQRISVPSRSPLISVSHAAPCYIRQNLPAHACFNRLVFPAISLFMLLQFPLGMVCHTYTFWNGTKLNRHLIQFSMITNSIISAQVSVNRIATFLRAEELQSDALTIPPPKPDVLPSGGSGAESFITPPVPHGETVLSIRDGEFRWSTKAPQPTLEDISLDVKMGELVGVFGRVGSGKVSLFYSSTIKVLILLLQSSLMSAIIGEMTRDEGNVEVFGSIAYAPQSPWIMSTTVCNLSVPPSLAAALIQATVIGTREHHILPPFRFGLLRGCAGCVCFAP